MAEPEHEGDLGRRLKELREDTGAGAVLKQHELGPILGVSGPTISAWESATNPKKPSSTRLEAYARFFAVRRPLEDGRRLLPAADLTGEERERYEELKGELLELLHPTSTTPPAPVPQPEPVPAPVPQPEPVPAPIPPSEPVPAPAAAAGPLLGHTFAFPDGRVTVVCPQAPGEARGPLAEENEPNFAKLQQYGDLDALVEMYGHLRACNPTLDVFHSHAGEVTADDLSNHVILLGGVGWNQVTKRFQDAIQQVPVTQIDVADYPDGDIFEVADEAEDDTGSSDETRGRPEKRRFYPEWEVDEHGRRNLVEDVGLIVRLPNPFNSRRTLTMCNGVHSRGVYGAVRSLTDSTVREANEEYLAERFPRGRFAVLLRVPVVTNRTMSPDLTNPTARLFEWPRAGGEQG